LTAMDSCMEQIHIVDTTLRDGDISLWPMARA
jgi:hypothetical protein